MHLKTFSLDVGIAAWS